MKRFWAYWGGLIGPAAVVALGIGVASVLCWLLTPQPVWLPCC